MAKKKDSQLPIPRHLWVQVVASWQLPPQVARVGERILRCYKDRRIATDMGLKIPTVRTYITRLFQLTDSDDRQDFIVNAWRKSREIEGGRV